MKQKRTYIQPSMRVIVIKSSPLLLPGSGLAPKGRFIDTEKSDYEWDESTSNSGIPRGVLMNEMWPSTVTSLLISNIRTQEKKP